MNWFFELAWLWKSLGIALLVSLAGVLCARLVCRTKGARLSAGIAFLRHSGIAFAMYCLAPVNERIMKMMPEISTMTSPA